MPEVWPKMAILCFFLFDFGGYARPLGQGFQASNQVDFSANWQELESPLPSPVAHLTKPYWESHAQKHLDALGYEERRFPDPVALHEKGLELKFFYLEASNWDQTLGYRLNNLGGVEGTIGFDTHGLGLELSARRCLWDRPVEFSWFRLDREEEFLLPQSNQGYNLVFGGRNSDVLGLAETNLDLLKAGQDIELEHRGDMRFSWLRGFSWQRLRRFERIRGNDRLGLNTIQIPRDPNVPNGASDPVVLEQGEDSVKSEGPGLYTGFSFQRELTGSVSLNSSALIHLMHVDQTHSLSVDQISRAGVKAQSALIQDSSQRTQTLLDFEVELRRWMRRDTSFSLGYRYLSVSEPSRQNLAGTQNDPFVLRGVSLGWHRRF